MPSTYSSNLRLEIMATNENNNTWGQKNNVNLNLIEDAISGYQKVTVSSGGLYSLSFSDAQVDQARNATFEAIGTLTSAAIIEAPAVEGRWVVRNSTTGSFDLVFKVSGSGGIIIPQGEARLVVSDAVTVTDGNYTASIVGRTLTLVSALPVISGGIGLSVTTSGAILVGAGSSVVQVAPGVSGYVLISKGSGVSPGYIPGGRLVGEMVPHGGNITSGAEPAGWLLCFGQAVSRVTYATLFAAIGTNWGVGDGVNTFNLPDGRGRVFAGIDNMGGVTANRLVNGSMASVRHTVGGSGGSDTIIADITGNLSNGAALDAGAKALDIMQPTFLGNWLIYTGV